MGTAQSYLSPDILVTAAVVAGAVGYGYAQVASSSSGSSDVTSKPSETVVGSGKKGKGKKKSSAASPSTPAIDTATAANVVPFPAVVPGQFDEGGPEGSTVSGAEATVSSKKRKKNKKAGKEVVTQRADGLDKAENIGVNPVEGTVSSSTVESLALADSSPSVSFGKASSKSKKKKQQASSQNLEKVSAVSTGASVPKPDPPQQQLQKSTASLASLATDSDGEWTRISRRADKARVSSDAGQTTSITTGTSSPADTRIEEAEEEEEEEDAVGMSGLGGRHPLAQRLLPKPKKTGVEDMLATSDYSSYSRVMRVQSGDKPAPGFSWGDYEDPVGGGNPSELEGDGGIDADREDDGWDVVQRGGRPKNKSASFSQQHVPTGKTPSDSETMNKRQRQNAAKREAQKSAKVEADSQRLATLAKHKRELERARMEAQYAKGGTKKQASGGMKAMIDEKGKLIWD